MALTNAARRALEIAMASSEIDPSSTAKEVSDKLEAVTGEDGVLIGQKDGTSMRIRGAQHSSEGGEQVQNYMGIFNNTGYDTVGTLKTRASFGGNLEMDVAIQSPHALLLIAQDGSQSDGIIKLASQNAVEFHCQYQAEELSPKRLIVDRESTAAKGSSNTSDVVLKANSGNLRLNWGITDGAPIVPHLSEAQRDALSAIAGMILYNTDASAIQGYDGTAWQDLHA